MRKNHFQINIFLDLILGEQKKYFYILNKKITKKAKSKGLKKMTN